MTNDILKYIPHRNSMVLIDKIVDHSLETFCVEVKVTTKSLLYSERGVPSYTGIEYMAQSIAAFNTLHYSKDGDERAKLGFIVSVRSFKSEIEFFKEGDVLNIFVEPILIVKNSGSFNAQIKINNNIVSTARVTAYVPTLEELEDLKKETSHE